MGAPEEGGRTKVSLNGFHGHRARCYHSSGLFNSYKDITSEVLNSLLANQKVSITQMELDQLKTVPGIKFDLPLNDQTFPAYLGLVGKPNTSTRRRPGVYIFTHLATGNK